MSVRTMFLNTIGKMIPPVSKSEQEALDAGTTGWEGSIFNGKPDWDKIVNKYSPTTFTQKEQSFIENETQTLCDMIDDWQAYEDKDLPQEIWDYMKDKKFLGMLIPEKHGGLGFTAQARAAVVTKVASRSIAAGVTVMVPNSLGPGELLERFGTDEQKEKYLEGLATGKEMPCFALTEPNAGSDAINIQARGIVERRQDTGEIGMRVEWDKRYITLAPVATLLGLAFHVHDPENLLGMGKEPGITVGLIPTDREGVEIGNRLRPLDTPFMNGTTRGKDVWIGEKDIIGGFKEVGNGWQMLVSCLSEGRANSLPSLSVAGTQLAAYSSGLYTGVRQQFGGTINKFEGLHEQLAMMAGNAYATDALRGSTLKMVDEGEKPTVPSAIAKYHATEMLRESINAAMDVHGGKGIIDGPSNYLSPVYKSIPVAITVEGANILTRNMLVFGQGSYRLHPHLRAMKDAQESGQAGKLLGHIAGAYIGSPLAAMAKNLVTKVTGGSLKGVPQHSPLKSYYKDVNRLSAAFSAVANPTSSYMGGDLKFRERISARLGDALSHLYIAASVLQKFEHGGQQKEEQAVAEWALQDHLSKAKEALNDTLRKGNYPDEFTMLSKMFGRPVGKVAATVTRRVLSLFAGQSEDKYQSPTNKMDAIVAKQLATDARMRDATTGGIYIPSVSEKPEEGLSRLAHAFKLAEEAGPAEAKLKKADRKAGLKTSTPLTERVNAAFEAGALTQDEADIIIRAGEARANVVGIDEFEPDAKTLYNPPRPISG